MLPCSEAWAKFVHAPAVERLVAASRGQVEAAYSRYMAAHDALVVRGLPCLSSSVSCCGRGTWWLGTPIMAAHTLVSSAACDGTRSGGLREPPFCLDARLRALTCTASFAPLPFETKTSAAVSHWQADPRYSAALAKSGELLAAVQGTAAYQAAAARLAPLLAPYADQAGKLAAPYLQAVTAHLAPVPAA